MKIQHIGAKIAHYRKLADINQSELARAVGVSAQAVQKWESKLSSPRVSKIPQISEVLRVSVRDLVEDTLFAGGFIQGEPRLMPLQGESRQIEEVQNADRLPLISWVQAGAWAEIQEGFLSDQAEDWIPCPFRHTESAFVLKIVGESMFNPAGERSYAPGEYIAVDPGREATNRSMVVVRMDAENQATFKQLIVDPDGTQMLQALNPNWPRRIIEIPPGSKIIGVVIGKWVPE